MAKNYTKAAKCLFCFILVLHVNTGFSQVSFRDEIREAAKRIDADVGISIIALSDNDTLSVNGDKRFPMQSVFKFHIALAALRLVDEGKLSLSQKYVVRKEHYFKTWSVVMRQHPEAGIEVTLEDLIRWMVMNSDNVACDILFDILGGPSKVNRSSIRSVSRMWRSYLLNVKCIMTGICSFGTGPHPVRWRFCSGGSMMASC